MFPEEGLVYDYRLDDGGITELDVDDDIEEEKNERKVDSTTFRPSM